MTANNILLLPVDILVQILIKLKLSDLRNVMLTCKTLRNLVENDNIIWKSLSRDRLIIHNNKDNRRSIEQSWYNRCRISHNWCHGYYNWQVVVHHYTNYMPWMIFHNSEVLITSIGSELYCYPTNKKGSPNCRVPLWKLDVPKIKRNDIRTNDISRFVIKNNLLVCGNRDGCVAVYGQNSIKTRPQLTCHLQDCHEDGLAEVTAVEVIDHRHEVTIVTASNDSPQIKFHRMHQDENNSNEISSAVASQYKTARIVPIYEGVGTKCLALNSSSDKLAAGLNGNSKPLLLDVSSGHFVMSDNTTMSYKQAVKDIRWHNENIIMFVTHSGLLQLIDIRTHEVIYHTRDPLQSTLYCVKSDGECAIVAGSAEYSRCVLFDIRKAPHHVQMYFTQRKTSPVYSLDFDSTKLITAVDRGIAVLNFDTNRPGQQRDYSHVFY